MTWRRRITAALAPGLALAFPAAAIAADKPAKPVSAAAFDRVAACRAITEAEARLACFDREVAAMDTAVRERKVAIVDQAEIRKTRRTLFGIPLPKIALFDNSGEPEVKEVTATIKSARQGPDGKLVFVLEDGAVWAQTDDWPLGSTVKPGQKVTLKRGTFGSYFADFEKTVTVRARRLR